MKPRKKQDEELGLNNMNGITHSGVVCDITNMNCVVPDDEETGSITNMNGMSQDENVSCGINDMNCRMGK